MTEATLECKVPASKTKPKRKVYSFSLHPTHKDTLQRKAEEEGLSMSRMIEMLIRNHLR